MERLYWGILSAGKISHDFVTALNDSSGPAAANNKVVAVAARQLDRAKSFAEKHGIYTVYGSYDELAQNGDINVVYIGVTTGQHYQCCQLMLNAGKHVLCEKSLTENAKQSEELYKLARSKGLFLMEALWSNFFPTYKEIKSQIEKGNLGQVLHMEASFGHDLRHVSRLSQRDLGGGASLDLGVYLVNLVRLVFNREVPEEIIARGELFPSGVDSGWDAILVFSGKRRAVLKCSSLYKLSNSGRISGDGGHIDVLNPFHCTDRISLPNGEEFTCQLPNQPAFEYNFVNSSGLSYEAAAVSSAIRNGSLECSEYTAEDSLYIARIIDEIQRQVGATANPATPSLA